MIEHKKAQISSIIQRTHDIISFRFDLQAPVEYKAGQCMSVELPHIGQKKPFSISSSPHQGKYLEFSKKMTGSEFSAELKKLKPGDCVNLRYPFGNFVLPENSKQKLCFLSGGIGVAAIIPMITYLAHTSPQADAVLFCGNKTKADIAFKTDFDDLEQKMPLLEIRHILSEEPGNWAGHKGFITADLIKSQIDDYEERKFFVCGPPPMVQAMVAIVEQELGLGKDALVRENFTGY